MSPSCLALGCLVFWLSASSFGAAPAGADVDGAATNLTLQIQCAPPFSNNAILQRGIPLPVWGTSLPGARVTVSYDKQTQTATADEQGKWRVVLDPLSAIKLASPSQVPEGKRMTMTAEHGGHTETKVLENLVVGDVWICAGQSNIAGRLGGNTGRYPGGTMTEVGYPGFRHLQMPKSESWLVCTPETAGQFKKVSFFFGRDVYRESGIPIGLLGAAVGGSRIETWLSLPPHERGKNHENLIAPIVGYGIRGAVWYQGESNIKDGLAYRPKLASLIQGWRQAWGQGDFPVYIVQLPGCGDSTDEGPDSEGGWPETRQAQFEILNLPNTGMAVTIDIGAKSVHPPNKYDTGVRLSRVALHHAYGFKDLVPTGPLYKSHRVDGDAIRIRFRYAEEGLMVAEKEGILPPSPTPDKKLGWLAIKAKDGSWHWADGRIDGSELVVSSDEVKEPVAVRYAYVKRPVGVMLYSKGGLPAAPFNTEAGTGK